MKATLCALLLFTTAATAAATAVTTSSAPPTGRWDGELAGGAPSGHLGNPGHNVPLLGNGYVGVVFQSSLGGAPSNTHGVVFNGSTLDLFVNTNANWDCEASGAPQDLPPAVCSMRGFGGLTLNIKNSTLAGAALSQIHSTRFAAEQRMANGSFWTQRDGADGSRVTTETVIHSEKNVLVTSVTFEHAGAGAATDGATIDVQLQLWTLGHTRHVRSSSSSLCTVEGTGKIPGCYRRYNVPNASNSSFFSPWTAIANRVIVAGVAGAQTPAALVNEDETSTATSTYTMHPGHTIYVVTTVRDNLLGGNQHNPTPDAATLALAQVPAAVAAESSLSWAHFWNASSVSLPTRPALERMWFGSMWSTRAGTASAQVNAKSNGKVPPPGLYGPFATADFAFWNGDFTLDYNQEANFFHVYSSNHPELAATYFQPLLDYMPAARAQAAQMAANANLSCDPKALSFPCHLAPWGHRSRDASLYQQWNGHYAATIFINAWEYTQDVAFAKSSILPLLDGLNAWTDCYLHKNGSVLEDWNAIYPDQIFENQPARNPGIGITLMMRVATAQIEIAKAVGMAYPAYLDNIVAKLVPLPVTQGPASPSVSNAGNGGNDGTGGGGKMKKNMITSTSTATVWAAAEGKSWSESAISSTAKNGVHFPSVIYPIYPSEMVSTLGTADPTTRTVARASAFLYSNLTCGTSFPESPYQTCVDSLGGGGLTIFTVLARVLPGTLGTASAAIGVGAVAGGGDDDSVTVKTMADSFETYIAAYGANSTNFLAYAPFGGLENVGLSQALNDMLVQSSAGIIHLFPAWPVDEPASFRTLRTKGAFLVSATWDAGSRTVADGASIVATVASHNVQVASRPFGAGIKTINLRCSNSKGSSTVTANQAGVFVWVMAAGETCTLSRGYRSR